MKFGGLSLTVGAAGALALMIVGASLSTTAGSNPDADGDGVVDLVDNCLGRANPNNAQGWQDDCDFDGFGDSCDGDLDNSGGTGAPDFLAFSKSYTKAIGSAEWNHCADMDVSGGVGAPDFLLFAQNYGQGFPGPSGLKCASTTAFDPNLTGQRRCWFLPNHRVRCPGGAAGTDHADILTDSLSGRDLRFINHKHYADLAGALGGHCN